MEIHWHNPEHVDVEERKAIEVRVEALARGRTDLLDVRISVRKNTHHRHGGDEVTIRCQMRGADAIVAKVTGNDIGRALREALVAFEREVHRLRDRRAQRRSERPPEPPLLGVVDRVFVDRDYGFILTDGGERVFFHKNALQAGLTFEEIEEGQRVALNVEPGDKGPQATTVGRPPPDASSP